jgi:hypothetical protein
MVCFVGFQSPSFGIKRESDTDSEASCMSNASKKQKKSGNKSNNNGSSSASATDASGANNNNGSPSKPKKPSGPSRKHVAMWDSNKLTTETMFIMGAK